MNWKIPAIGTWGGTSLLLAVLSLHLATAAQASAVPWQQLRPVGQGEMNWLWFKLYDATLYSESGRYQPSHYPQALTLTYARAIEREDLLSATAKEWQRLGLGSDADRQRWLGQLATLWPDVAAGDRLTFYVDEAEPATSGGRSSSSARSPNRSFPPPFWLSGWQTTAGIQPLPAACAANPDAGALYVLLPSISSSRFVATHAADRMWCQPR